LSELSCVQISDKGWHSRFKRSLQAALLLLAIQATATNGYFLAGVMENGFQGAGGVGIALPLDSLTVATNPAGLTAVGRRAELRRRDISSAAPRCNARCKAARRRIRWQRFRPFTCRKIAPADTFNASAGRVWRFTATRSRYQLPIPILMRVSAHRGPAG